MRRRIGTFALAAALVACAGTAPAQSAQLRAGAWWLVGKDVFNGAGLSASLPLPRNFLVEAHWQRGAGQPLAVLCAFPPPGTYCRWGARGADGRLHLKSRSPAVTFL